MTYNVDYETFAAETGIDGFTAGIYMWLWVYIDPAGNYSSSKVSPLIVLGLNEHIVWRLMPGVYSGEIDRLEMYRSDKLVEINTGSIDVDVTYIVYSNPSTDAITYNGNAYTGGQTFIGVTGHTGYSAAVSAKVYAYPTSWGFIGKVESADEGVFLDDFIELGKPFHSVGGEYNYESDIRWSEPYRPNHIRLENVASFRLGDGKQITGLGVLYGNLVVFKETSIGRYAVQASAVPISRVDEVSNEIGCIAPNTLVQVANTLYFLSWKGLMKYDNNQLSKVDGLFDEELQFRLRNAGLHEIRKASCGYNNTYNELYLNFPFTGDNDGNSAFEGETDSFGTQRTLRGHIYVVSLDKGYATKFAYGFDRVVYDGSTNQTVGQDPVSGVTSPRDAYSHARIYYTNSLGELRSAETGEHYSVWDSPPTSATEAKIPAFIFIDAPTEIDTDFILPTNIWIDYNNTIEPSPDYDQDSYDVDIINLWRSKHFTGDKEHNIKRVRKISINRWQRTGDGVVTVHSVPFGSTDDRIDEDGFVTTATYASGANIITVIPRTVVDSGNAWLVDDYGKPIRFWVQYEGSSRTHINAASFWWRPIHKYTP